MPFHTHTCTCTSIYKGFLVAKEFQMENFMTNWYKTVN